MLESVLTRDQWNAGLRLSEVDDHTVVLHKTDGDTIAVFGIHATIEEIRKTAKEYLDAQYNIRVQGNQTSTHI